MKTSGFLGIDAGTQGLSVIFTDQQLQILGTGEGTYDMVPGLGRECYEQLPTDWERALGQAMSRLRENLSSQRVELDVQAIGISGQMHGEVLADAAGVSLGSARLWCDGRNQAEGDELTARLDVKMPKRITSARWLWTVRQQPERAAAVAHLTTPAGWLAYRLTGRWNLGIGDAAGMFPIDQQTQDYDQRLLDSFDELVARSSSGRSPIRPLRELLPRVRRAGEDGGVLDAHGAALLQLPAAIPVAPAEGDQPAALAGSLIGRAGMVSMSFGTSVCANSVGDRPFHGVSQAIDHFCAPDGKPINMVYLRNGTTFMNAVIEMFGAVTAGGRGQAFELVMPQLLAVPADCGGLLALPFMDDEPGLGVDCGGTALVVGLNGANATPGHVAKAALLSTIFNLRLGSEVLAEQGFPRTQIILSGGLTKTPELGQIVADAFATPVSILAGAHEGTAWGAALLAKFRHQHRAGQATAWDDFLAAHAAGAPRQFAPVAETVQAYDRLYARYRRLVALQGQVSQAVDDRA